MRGLLRMAAFSFCGEQNPVAKNRSWCYQNPLSLECTKILRARAEKLKVEQSDIARGVGTSRATISKLFNGEQSPTLDQIDVISRYLGMDIVELVKLASEKALVRPVRLPSRRSLEARKINEEGI
jgi:transcriptional regulator with XRE-family HTH domain